MSRVLDDAQIMPRLHSACINNYKFQEGGLDVSDMLDVTKVLGLTVADPTRNALRQRLCEALYPEQITYPEQQEEEQDDGFTKVKGKKPRARKATPAAAEAVAVPAGGNDKVAALAYELFNQLADRIDKMLSARRPPPGTHVELLKYKAPQKGKPSKSDLSLMYFGDVPYATLLKGPADPTKGKNVVRVLDLLNEQYASEGVRIEDARNTVSLVYGEHPDGEEARKQLPTLRQLRVESSAPSVPSAWKAPPPPALMAPLMFPTPEPAAAAEFVPAGERFTGRKGLLARTRAANPEMANAIVQSAYRLANELADKIDMMLETSRARPKPYAYVEILRYQLPRKGNKPSRVYYEDSGVPYAVLLHGPVERADTKHRDIVRVIDLLNREYAPLRVIDHYNYGDHRNEVYLVLNDQAWEQKLAKSRARYDSLSQSRAYIKPDRAEGYARFS